MRAITTAAPTGHQPVLLTETITTLQPRSGGRYLDGTFGGGGHTRAILEASAPDGIVLALDADPAAIARGESLWRELADPNRLRLVQANFADLAQIANETGLAPFDGILLDLGLSSFQLDDPARGFAFRHEGPLDMRFDPSQGRPAADLVNELPQAALADLLYRYGEEPRSRRIAAAIVRARSEAPIETTTRLAEIVSGAVGGRRGRDIHPATQTFQALRIAVNGELVVLEQALDAAASVLAPGGRLGVISFHSLEDRIVKRFLQRESATCICPPEQPICTCDHHPRLRPLTRAVRATTTEQAANPRSRSAILRAAERLADGGVAATVTNTRVGHSARDSNPGLSEISRLKPTKAAREARQHASHEGQAQSRHSRSAAVEYCRDRHLSFRPTGEISLRRRLQTETRDSSLRLGMARYCVAQWHSQDMITRIDRNDSPVGFSRLISLSSGLQSRVERSTRMFPMGVGTPAAVLHIVERIERINDRGGANR